MYKKSLGQEDSDDLACTVNQSLLSFLFT